MADTAESVVKFMLEMWGKNPRNPKYGTWLANAKRKVEAAVGTPCGGTQVIYPRDGDLSVQVKQANSEIGEEVNQPKDEAQSRGVKQCNSEMGEQFNGDRVKCDDMLSRSSSPPHRRRKS